MGTTSNYSWPYPESSDYVADGATAIENLADAVDTTVDTLINNKVEYIGTNRQTAAGYPSTCSSFGGWMIPVNVPVTTTGETMLVTFSATWNNTAANVIIFRLHDSGTALTHDMLTGRFASGQNNAAGSFIFTPPSGSRGFYLHFASSTGTMQAFGSEQEARLTVYRIQP